MIDTTDIIKRVRRIELRTRRIVDELTGGAYHSVFKGKGMEFDEVREYFDGDDVRAIDWNVTARMGHPFIKKFVEERELTVMLLVDMSGSGDFGSASQAKNQLAAELAALLAFSAIRNNDRVGLQLFTATDELHVPARKGKAHVLRLIRELLAFERTERGTNIRGALENLMRVAKRKAVVFVISDFLDDDFTHALRIASKRHDVVAMRVVDERDLEPLPAGFLNLEDAETGATSLFASWLPGSRARSREAMQGRLDKTAEGIRRSGVDLIDIVNGQDYVKPLMAFFRARERRR